MTICLTPEEIFEITRRQKYAAQRKVLNALGIEHKTRPDGSLMVKRSDYDTPARPQASKKRVEPNWGAING